ncbi:unnamed protein product [Phaeothamnion confervicola]
MQQTREETKALLEAEQREGKPVEYRRQWDLGFTTAPPSWIATDGLRSSMAEFIGTLLLIYLTSTVFVFIREGTEKEELVDSKMFDAVSRLVIAAAFGFTAFVLVFIFGAISEAHLNPAVTLAFWVGKRTPVVLGLMHIAAQLLGAVCGAYIAKMMDQRHYEEVKGGANVILTTEKAALGAEILATYLLTTAYLVATSTYMTQVKPYVPNNVPLAAGMSVFVGNLALIPIDKAALNPARAFGPAVVAGVWTSHWVFWVGPILGALLAVFLFEAVLRPPEPVRVVEQQFGPTPPHPRSYL